MTFTDDDLKRLKEILRYAQDNQPSLGEMMEAWDLFKALLSRLEAQDIFANHAVHCHEELRGCQFYKEALKAAGK